MTQPEGTSPKGAPCWCVNVSFSAELLARVPPQAERQACICQRCATGGTPHE
jgi:hypothetical protein